MSKNIKSISNPKLKLEILTTEEVKKIHDATLWIIEHVGVRFPSQRALEIWEANGATVDREKKIVRVKGDVIEVREKSKQLVTVLESVGLAERDVPDYIEADHSKMKATFSRVPGLADVPYPVVMEPHLVIEFYSR